LKVALQDLSQSSKCSISKIQKTNKPAVKEYACQVPAS